MNDKTDDSNELHLKRLQDLISDSAKSAAQLAILLNGAATISLLAFQGSIWSTKIGETSSDRLVYAILVFLFGVLAASVAIMSDVGAHYSYYKKAQSELNTNANDTRSKSKIKSTVVEDYEKYWDLHIGINLHFIRASYFLFTVGAGMSTAWMLFGD